MAVALQDSTFLRACRREPAGQTPVWFMRQAGRSLPEYRALRAKHSFAELSQTPELCAQVTLQPIERLGVDAAILFADIMTPLMAIGVGVELVENVGPVVRQPVRAPGDLTALRPMEPGEDIAFLTEAIGLIKHELGDRVPLIGFAGAPFTLAAYLIEGGSSRTFAKTKALMYREPALWGDLMERLAAITVTYLRAQVAAGVDAVQLFDSWVGSVGPDDYVRYVRPAIRQITSGLADTGVPFIHFGTDTATLLGLMKDDGASVVGVDWRVPLDLAWDVVGHDRAVQGNLDPAVLLAPWEVVEAKAADVLRRAAGRPGHVFNLGHGIYPETPVDTIKRLVDYVHSPHGRLVE